MVERKANFVDLSHYNRPKKKIWPLPGYLVLIDSSLKDIMGGCQSPASPPPSESEHSEGGDHLADLETLMRYFWAQNHWTNWVTRIEYPIACIWVLIVPIHNYHYENLRLSYLFWEDPSNTNGWKLKLYQNEKVKPAPKHLRIDGSKLV